MILALIFLILALVLGCNSYIFKDYFPLKEGIQWIYTDGNVELLAYVEDLDSVFHLILGNKNLFLIREFECIYQKREISKTYLGEKIVFDKINEFYLPNPMINNDSFSLEDTFIKIYSGNTIFFYYKNTLSVEFIKKLQIPGKNFKNCYKVKRFLILDCDTIQTIEYYAPEIGLVKFEEKGKIFYIKEWFLH